MATTETQRRWRARTQFSKKQLNVVARVETHAALEDIGKMFNLHGKAEAVTFSCFVVRWLMQRAEHDPQARELLDTMSDLYHRDREIHAP